MDKTGNTKEKVKRMQTIVFKIVCDIDDFCREKNIMYFLSGGSTLGAVRHKGFIPWDDDADIMLPREEYDRFLKEYPGFCEKRYGIGALEIDKTWVWQYARVWDLHSRCSSDNLDEKITGVYVDVFPIDGLPSNKLRRKIYYMKLRLWRGLGNACLRKEFRKGEKNRIFKTILKMFVKPFGARYFAEKMDHLARKYSFTDSEFVGVSMAAHYGERETIRKENMQSALQVEFEGRMLPIPVGYEEYLSNLYGDYMKIPKDAEKNGYSHLDHWTVDFDEGKR